MNRLTSCNFRYGLTIPLSLVLGAALSGCTDEQKVTTIPVAPTIRQLTTRPLFGGMPIDNRVLDPEFALIDFMAWVPVAYEMPRLSRVFLAQTPLGQPALWVPSEGNTTDLELLGSAKSAEGPLDASVWFGRKIESADTELMRVFASVIGLFADGGEASVDMALDAATAPMVLDDMVWRRYAVHLPEAPAGWLYLALSNNALSDLYISSPIVVGPPPTLGLSPTTFVGHRRPLTDREKRALVVARENELRHLSKPQPKQLR